MQYTFEFYRPLPRRPERPERLIFMLFPGAEASIRAGQLSQRFVRHNRLVGTPLKAERLHISLQHVGDYKRLRTKFVYAARKVGEAVSMQPFEVTFRVIGSLEGGRPGRRPLVLFGEGEGLFEIHDNLGAAMEKNGLKAGTHFTPHLTLFYGPKAIPMQPVEPVRFVASEFALIHSEVGLSRYNTLGRWSLV